MSDAVRICHSDDRERWLAERMAGVGGSDIAAVLGEDKHRTREQARMEKAGLADPFAGNEATELGHAMEPTVATIARARWGWQLERYGWLIRDHVCCELIVTPDYVMPTPYGPATVQIKFSSCQATEDCRPRKDGSPSTAEYAGGPPLRLQLQIQAELAALGWQHGVLLVLHLQPMKLRAYYVPRHDGAIARIRSDVPVFMREVRALKEGRMTA